MIIYLVDVAEGATPGEYTYTNTDSFRPIAWINKESVRGRFTANTTVANAHFTSEKVLNRGQMIRYDSNVYKIIDADKSMVGFNLYYVQEAVEE